MRRKDREISKQITLSILQFTEYGLLSVASVNKESYGVSLNYYIPDGAVYFHCAAEGRKIFLLDQNKKVSFSVVGKS
jgi:nitroimidazol reductase NimA-like FMN-containing flavoprotein (pyridoxamine 5'-phosphate oxidase superfamily)